MKGVNKVKDYSKKILILGMVTLLATLSNGLAIGHQTETNDLSREVAVKCLRQFRELPITAINPEGWLRQFLENQKNGLTGHLEVAGFPYNTCGWSCEKVVNLQGHSWWPYEQTAYWIDGMIRCGYLLQDDFLIQKAKKHLNYTLAHPDAKGMLGPRHIKNAWWPYAVFFRALMAEYSATADKAIIEAMKKHDLSGTSGYHKYRDVCNVEQFCWLYEITGDERLLNQAIEMYQVFNEKSEKWGLDTTIENLLSDKKPTIHGVTFMETIKLPAILYMYTGEKELLEAAINGFKKLDRDHMLISGVPSSCEFLNGRSSRTSHETCNVTDFSWSAGYMLMITGQAEWADKIERACFNAGIGSITKDFKALQYFSSPNQFLATKSSSHVPGFVRSKMSYRPGHDVECCTGNVNRFMPNYIARMWLSDKNGGLVAAMYGPSSVQTRVGKDGVPVTVIEKTDYPFSERIEFEIQAEKKVRFPFWLRIPAWCQQPKVTLNDQPMNVDVRPGTFLKLDHEFSDKDKVVLLLPMSLKLSHWPKEGLGVERGPLVYSLAIKESREVVDTPKSSDKFPAWDMTPISPWNYALKVDKKQLEEQMEVVRQPMTANPWTVDEAPIKLLAPARRVRQWILEKVKDDEDNQVYTHTPDLPDPEGLSERLEENTEMITLVPYGCTLLRLTIFPLCPQVTAKN